MIKNLLLAIFITAFSLPVTASHVISANIYWEHITGNQFMFKLELTRDCSGISAPSSATITGPSGSIPCTQVSSTYFSTNFCTPSSATNCSGNNNGVQVVTYESDTITLSGSPPASGWEFSWTTCCRPSLENTNASGIYTSSVMYPLYNNGFPGIPQVSTLSSLEIPSFYFSPAGGKYSYNLKPKPGNDVDVIQAMMSSPMDAANSAISWSSGYSNTSPLPDQSENVNNGPFSFDPQSGIAAYENYNVSEGMYVYSLDHVYYKNGQAVARITKNIAHVLKNDTSANVQPQITISENGQTTLFNQSPLNYNLRPGDSLELIITGKDIGQFLSVESYGAILNAARHSNVANYNHALIQSLNPSNTLAANDSVKLKLSFVPDLNNAMHLPNPARVILTFTDTLCSGPKQVAMPILIYTSPVLQISNQLNALELCSGAQDSLSAASFPNGSYWSPGNFVSDSTAANVIIDSQAQGWLYLRNPNYATFYDSIEIKRFDSTGFYLHKTNNNIQLVDNYNVPFSNWFYDGFPVSPTNQNINIFANGNYSVAGDINTNCTLTASRTVSDVDYSYNNIPPTPLSIRKGTLPWANGFTFALNLPFNNQLTQVTLLGVEDQVGMARSSDVYLSIFDENDVNISNLSVTVTEPKGEPIVFQVNAPTQGYKNYRLLVSSNNNLIFNSITGVNLPLYGKSNGDFVVKEMIQASSHSSSRTIADTIMPAVAMQFQYNVGLTEMSTESMHIYPNPASDKITLSQSLSQDVNLQIFSLSGHLIREFFLPEGETEIDVKALPTGAYFIKLNESAYRFMKQ